MKSGQTAPVWAPWPRSAAEQAVLERVSEMLPEMAGFAAALVRIPTVNPPGEHYEDCARFIGERYARFGYQVRSIAAEGREEHTARYPRMNVLGRLDGERAAQVMALATLRLTGSG